MKLAAALEPSWALKPVALAQHRGQPALVFDDPGGQTLDCRLGSPMELGRFLVVAVGLCGALRETHAKGLIHKDIKPANALVGDDGRVRLMGFGFATQSPRERQAPALPQVIAGSLQYMAPEQTGRMNRLIDQRSDLYALGVTLYEMLTGGLPFAATDPLEWIHCHIARAPPPPGLRVTGVPATVEAIILKLLAKNADERYQTAAGVERDLIRYHAAWLARRKDELFKLGEHDRTHRLIIPQRLFGREAEISVLSEAFDGVRQGKPGMVLVSGASGLGKSAIVAEMQPRVHAAHGLFAAGRFDPQKRDIPYSTIAEAFRGMLRQILGRDDRELAQWRAAFRDALGASGQLIADLMPELGLILGKLEPPLLLSTGEEKARFELALRRFIGVFARSEHALVLALDDLQWADAATLDLLRRLATRDEIPHLLVVCGYRRAATR